MGLYLDPVIQMAGCIFWFYRDLSNGRYTVCKDQKDNEGQSENGRRGDEMSRILLWNGQLTLQADGELHSRGSGEQLQGRTVRTSLIGKSP